MQGNTIKDLKRISLPEITKEKIPEISSLSIAEESEVFAGNGPAQSVNQSEYSMIKNLVEKISKSPKHNSSIDVTAEMLSQEVATLSI